MSGKQPSGRDPVRTQEEITHEGNPARPQGEAGEQMLTRMNESHAALTGWALGFWQIEPTDRILDIGCGGGAALHRMAPKVTAGQLTGVDYSPVSVSLSRKNNAREISEGRMEIREASVEKLPFSGHSFDKVLTVESFYFWPNPPENLREVLRVLKPGGVFLLAADIYGKEDLPEKSREAVRDYSLYNPTKDEFERLFSEAGFSRVCLHTEEGRNWICVEGHA